MGGEFLKKELWKDIPEYEGCYQVSNYGRVRSVDRDVAHTIPGFTQHIKGFVLKGTDNGNGYLVVVLNRDGKRKNHYIHRLVAAAFCENPDKKNQVNHLDHNRQNNAADNLEWCTQKENVRYSAPLGKHPKENAKLSSVGIKYIQTRTKNGVQVYRVVYKPKHIDKCFKTLDEAMAFLEGVFA